MADVNINTATIASAIDPTDYLHATIGNSFNRITVQTLIDKAKAQALAEMEAALLDKLTEGCFIYYFLASTKPRYVKASEWAAAQGHTAIGVLLLEAGHRLLIAPTESSTTLTWASVNAGAGTYVTTTKEAFADFDGRVKTSAILADSKFSGDGAGYAPGFCNAYSVVDGEGNGRGAGEWWLPSMGELGMMWANKTKLNLCLSLIPGATPLESLSYSDGTGYYSSTEKNSSYAWSLNFATGNSPSDGKANFRQKVRPVSY